MHAPATYTGPNPLTVDHYERLQTAIKMIDDLRPLCDDAAQCGAKTQGYADALDMMRQTAESLLAKFFPHGKPE